MARALLPCRLLIIDDNASARGSLHHLLDAMGFAIEARPSGAAAIEQLASADAPACDLILLDWRMPGMDGLATIHAIDTLADITPPTILILGTPEDLQEARQAVEATDLEGTKIAGYLTKPVTLAPLLDLMRKVLGPRQAESVRG
jgi:CheY-like chemotaxis protein